MRPETSPAYGALDGAVSVFVELRPRLFGIAYRLLGSAAEAEDVVQEVWLRWQTTDRSVVRSPAAFLSTATTRLAINVAQSSRVQREAYIGPWLPEPADTSSDPAVGAQRAEALDFAILLILEKLTPTERAAYVLREAFDFPYVEIGEMLHLTAVNIRKIVSRARAHLATEQRRKVDSAEHQRLLDAFVAAAQKGDMASLAALLAPNAISLSDGNGMRGVARVPVLGRARVANLSIAYPRFWGDAEVECVQANGRGGVLLHRDGCPSTFMTIAASDEGIHHVMWVFNPMKIAAYLGSRSRYAAVPGTSREPLPERQPTSLPKVLPQDLFRCPSSTNIR
ncbi:sigma-70 family RNA polymerase sigma factor [Streptomyces sp. NPDC026673]|uniref:sigma-70 family RNA polymerase sigma factor n=1 Tax=Streptomyces sp. NPDC026673 TaxID=3155724 RepID=UPI0033CA3F5E